MRDGMKEPRKGVLNQGDMQSYGCTVCQCTHYSDQPVFEKHIGWQSKHGIRTVPSFVVADEREATHWWKTHGEWRTK